MTPDIKTIEWIIGQGIGAVLAFGMFLVYRKDVKNGLGTWRGQTEILMKLVGENTAAMQRNTDAINQMESTLPHACPMADQVASGAVEFITRSTNPQAFRQREAR